ncbi:hypothetical protein G647_07147 [Cladophialophora carrionii CBS 160.54]|uniref:Zn(2)-C6 fungal-type domain-containing protein n=1 Tax=Cladophialophora carrionii CBS 160.54 TaxID=1279043 RepID=V9D1N9_9EURO|nr:uncharacterized protein G647_07147 [Cladophialophora carrionii CBS 160.54]ETI20805.1 hypothetical protein G647_07147 [Cladophialophora carrionii CBS 160.54]
MSGSPPPERPAEPPQIAGRRRKRSHTPPVTTTATTLAPITPLDTSAARPATLLRGGETLGELAVQHDPYALNYPPPPTTYQAASTLLSSSTSVQDSRFALSPISPRTTRKPKAHVASACVNCKRKHLRCDASRPCRRCVQSGKEDTCRDVEHKKRGRPPLKAEDQANVARYQASTAHYPSSSPAGAAPLGPPTRFPTFSQGPGLTPLLPSPAPWFRSQQQGMPAYYPTPVQPSISSSLATAEGSFVPPSSGPYGIRPPILPGQSPSPYTSRAESTPQGTAYASYPFTPQGQPERSYYSNPIFPPQIPSTLPSEQLAPLQTSSALQLPPINFPAPSGLIDPAIVQQPAQSTRPSPRGGQESRDDGTQEPDPKRPKMDIKGILGPRND